MAKTGRRAILYVQRSERVSGVIALINALDTVQKIQPLLRAKKKTQ